MAKFLEDFGPLLVSMGFRPEDVADVNLFDADFTCAGCESQTQSRARLKRNLGRIAGDATGPVDTGFTAILRAFLNLFFGASPEQEDDDSPLVAIRSTSSP